MIKVIIFSDIRIYCEGLSNILSNIDSIQVVGVENIFEGAISKISQVSPDVVLLDMTMTGACCTAKTIIECYPESKVVALSAPEDEKNIIQCAEAGIAGYVAREASLDELIDAVKGTESGQICYPPKVATYIFSWIRRLAQGGENRALPKFGPIENKDVVAGLTNRECEISQLLSEGLPNKQIARILSIEVSTVKNHVHNILVKLDVKNRVQVVSMLRQSTPRTEI
jgi:two-component system nitrate/nitrite response regulator NarL